MENELIIDGQAVPMSENHDPQPQNETEQQDNGGEVDTSTSVPDAAADNAEADQDQQSGQEQDYSLQIGDEEISLSDDDENIEGKPAPQWVKDLRKGFKDTQKENRELKRQLEEITARQTQQPAVTDEVVPPKPTLESCDWNDEVFETALTEWHEKKVRAERQQQERMRAQQEIQSRFTERLQKHNERAKKLPVKDYAEMEEVVRVEVPPLQQEILIHAADEGTELIAYALGKNKELRQRLTAEKDPIRAAFLLGQISQKVKLAPKPKKSPKPEPEVKGGAGNAASDEFNKLCPGAIIE
ncbi:phage capsid protein [Morganella morganii]|uniref:phage capsid protein n=1 Tax=Morganella morganii TaxID=582 RepID=UPI003EBED78C